MSKILLTGVKPTALPHWGNYLGAIRPGLRLMNDFESSYLFIADYHALTTIHSAKEMKEFSYQVAATWLACGLDLKKCIIYRQSDVPEIFELNWILSCFTPKGFMNRAHAYKARLQENKDAQKDDDDFGVSMGLYCYPVLMSADILLFNADVVPVGEDQVQHVEFARDIAQKFNRVYGEIIKLPKAHVQLKKNVPGLDGRKMSKSYDNTIPLFLDDKKMRKLIMKIMTDSTPPEAPKNPEESLIFDLFKEFANAEQIAELDKAYRSGIGWGDAKQKLFEVAFEYFKPMTEKYNSFISKPDYLESVLSSGAAQARQKAQAHLTKIRNAIGVKV